MIKTISTQDNYLSINQYSNFVYPNNSVNNGGLGMVRYNFSTHTLEVYDGSNWRDIGINVGIGLNPSLSDVLNWAKNQQEIEKRAGELAKENVTIADALEKVNDAKSQLQELVILCEKSS